jgi:thiazole synthase ThiGH ThiG subunit
VRGDASVRACLCGLVLRVRFKANKYGLNNVLLNATIADAADAVAAAAAADAYREAER